MQGDLKITGKILEAGRGNLKTNFSSQDMCQEMARLSTGEEENVKCTMKDSV